ncbi:MAG: hypothetical protein COB20_09835 [SAR86 cluster bacterium]|uniref:TonB C-terminal domain-containing protein n=1 Tax=SAR86 cluster bacterium TaxID=2030880 RepID=A0A2A4X3U4_9GAMM|nr:MAG: hypothetical protein COB20_09835 [SAR86 cluster bacterium]
MMRFFPATLVLFCSYAVSQTADISSELESNILGNIAIRKLQSMVIGIVDENGRRYYTYGEPVDNSSPWLNEHSVFPLGSLSETFVGILLADSVLRGSIDLDNSVGTLLPEAIEASGVEMTLLDIAAHQSASARPIFLGELRGLKTEEALYTSFVKPQLLDQRLPAGLYTNLEFSLLALLLANQSETKYESMLNERLLQPLGLGDTKLQSLYFENYFNAIEKRDVNLEAGYGMHSTANDMLTYLEANIGLRDTSLRAAMDYSHIQRAEHDSERLGLSWYINEEDETELYHDGAFFVGWSSQIRFSKSRRLGVIVLAKMYPTSTNAQYEIDPIARHIFDSEVELDNAGLNRQALPRNLVQADYPEGLNDKSISGSVIVEVSVNLRGDVMEASVFESNLDEDFEVAALAAAMRLKFNPRLENGRKVAETGITYRFDF